jgi:Tol biopolymer transport system component
MTATKATAIGLMACGLAAVTGGVVLVAMVVISDGDNPAVPDTAPIAVHYSRGIYTVPPDGAPPTLTYTQDGSEFLGGGAYSVSADGKRIAFDSGGRLCLASLSPRGAPEEVAEFEHIRDVKLSPSGREVFVSASPRTGGRGGFIVDVASRDVQPLPPGFPERIVSWTPDGRFVVIRGSGEAAVTSIAGRDGIDQQQLTHGIADVAWSPGGADLALSIYCCPDRGVYLLGPDGALKQLTTTEPGPISAPAWSPKGTHIAFVGSVPSGGSFLDEIRVLTIDTGQETRVVNATDPTWSPDGERLAFLREGNAYVINRDGTGETRVTHQTQPFVNGPHWLPDNSILFGFAPPFDHSLHTIEPDGEKEAALGYGDDPIWSPDSDHIAFMGDTTGPNLSGHNDVYVASAAGSSVRKVTSLFWDDIVAPCEEPQTYVWSPDGDVIVVGFGHFPVRPVDSDSLPTAPPNEPPRECNEAEVAARRIGESRARGDRHLRSSDGERTALLRGSSRNEVYIVDSDGDTERRLDLDCEPLYCSFGLGEWASDGRKIALTARGLNGDEGDDSEPQIVVWDTRTGKIAQVARGTNPHWSPDSRRLVFEVATPDGSELHIVNADASSDPEFLTKGTDALWSPDGKRIAFMR